MVQFSQMHTSFYSSTIVTMAISRTVSDIKPEISRKSRLFVLHSI